MTATELERVAKFVKAVNAAEREHNVSVRMVCRKTDYTPGTWVLVLFPGREETELGVGVFGSELTLVRADEVQP